MLLYGHFSELTRFMPPIWPNFKTVQAVGQVNKLFVNLILFLKHSFVLLLAVVSSMEFLI